MFTPETTARDVLAERRKRLNDMMASTPSGASQLASSSSSVPSSSKPKPKPKPDQHTAITDRDPKLGMKRSHAASTSSNESDPSSNARPKVAALHTPWTEPVKRIPPLVSMQHKHIPPSSSSFAPSLSLPAVKPPVPTPTPTSPFKPVTKKRRLPGSGWNSSSPSAAMPPPKQVPVPAPVPATANSPWTFLPKPSTFSVALSATSSNTPMTMNAIASGSGNTVPSRVANDAVGGTQGISNAQWSALHSSLQAAVTQSLSTTLQTTLQTTLDRAEKKLIKKLDESLATSLASVRFNECFAETSSNFAKLNTQLESQSLKLTTRHAENAEFEGALKMFCALQVKSNREWERRMAGIERSLAGLEKKVGDAKDGDCAEGNHVEEGRQVEEGDGMSLFARLEALSWSVGEVWEKVRDGRAGADIGRFRAQPQPQSQPAPRTKAQSSVQVQTEIQGRPQSTRHSQTQTRPQTPKRIKAYTTQSTSPLTTYKAIATSPIKPSTRALPSPAASSTSVGSFGEGVDVREGGLGVCGGRVEEVAAADQRGDQANLDGRRDEVDVNEHIDEGQAAYVNEPANLITIDMQDEIGAQGVGTEVGAPKKVANVDSLEGGIEVDSTDGENVLRIPQPPYINHQVGGQSELEEQGQGSGEKEPERDEDMGQLEDGVIGRLELDIGEQVQRLLDTPLTARGWTRPLTPISRDEDVEMLELAYPVDDDDLDVVNVVEGEYRGDLEIEGGVVPRPANKEDGMPEEDIFTEGGMHEQPVPAAQRDSDGKLVDEVNEELVQAEVHAPIKDTVEDLNPAKEGLGLEFIKKAPIVQGAATHDAASPRCSLSGSFSKVDWTRSPVWVPAPAGPRDVGDDDDGAVDDIEKIIEEHTEDAAPKSQLIRLPTPPSRPPMLTLDAGDVLSSTGAPLTRASAAPASGSMGGVVAESEAEEEVYEEEVQRGEGRIADVEEEQIGEDEDGKVDDQEPSLPTSRGRSPKEPLFLDITDSDSMQTPGPFLGDYLAGGEPEEVEEEEEEEEEEEDQLQYLSGEEVDELEDEDEDLKYAMEMSMLPPSSPIKKPKAGRAATPPPVVAKREGGEEEIENGEEVDELIDENQDEELKHAMELSLLPPSSPLKEVVTPSRTATTTPTRTTRQPVSPMKSLRGQGGLAPSTPLRQAVPVQPTHVRRGVPLPSTPVHQSVSSSRTPHRTPKSNLKSTPKSTSNLTSPIRRASDDKRTASATKRRAPTPAPPTGLTDVIEEDEDEDALDVISKGSNGVQLDATASCTSHLSSSADAHRVVSELIPTGPSSPPFQSGEIVPSSPPYHDVPSDADEEAEYAKALWMSICVESDMGSVAASSPVKGRGERTPRKWGGLRGVEATPTRNRVHGRVEASPAKRKSASPVKTKSVSRSPAKPRNFDVGASPLFDDEEVDGDAGVDDGATQTGIRVESEENEMGMGMSREITPIPMGRVSVGGIPAGGADVEDNQKLEREQDDNGLAIAGQHQMSEDENFPDKYEEDEQEHSRFGGSGDLDLQPQTGSVTSRWTVQGDQLVLSPIRGVSKKGEASAQREKEQDEDESDEDEGEVDHPTAMAVDDEGEQHLGGHESDDPGLDSTWPIEDEQAGVEQGELGFDPVPSPEFLPPSPVQRLQEPAARSPSSTPEPPRRSLAKPINGGATRTTGKSPIKFDKKAKVDGDKKPIQSEPKVSRCKPTAMNPAIIEITSSLEMEVSPRVALQSRINKLEKKRAARKAETAASRSRLSSASPPPITRKRGPSASESARVKLENGMNQESGEGKENGKSREKQAGGGGVIDLTLSSSESELDAETGVDAAPAPTQPRPRSRLVSKAAARLDSTKFQPMSKTRPPAATQPKPQDRHQPAAGAKPTAYGDWRKRRNNRDFLDNSDDDMGDPDTIVKRLPHNQAKKQAEPKPRLQSTTRPEAKFKSQSQSSTQPNPGSRLQSKARPELESYSSDLDVDTDSSTDIIRPRKALGAVAGARGSGPPKVVNLKDKIRASGGESLAATRVKKRKAKVADANEVDTRPLKRAREAAKVTKGKTVNKGKEREKEVEKDRVNPSSGSGKDMVDQGRVKAKLVEDQGLMSPELGDSIVVRRQRVQVALSQLNTSSSKTLETQPISPVTTSTEKRKMREKTQGEEWPTPNQHGNSKFQREFVKCDNCSAWFHYGCVGIEENDIRIEDDEAVFTCPTCYAEFRSGRMHDSKRKPSRTRRGACGRPGCPQVSRQRDEYFVERVIGRRYDAGKEQHEWLLKWDGYPISEATWQGEEDMQQPGKLIDEFQAIARAEGASLKNPLETVSLKAAKPWW